MKLLDDYFRAKAAVHEHFGYRESWKDIPLADYRDQMWKLDLNGEQVLHADTEEELRTGEGNAYSDEIFTYVHFERHVWRAGGFAMIMIDTNTDGNKFLAVFDETKERPNLKVDDGGDDDGE